MVNSPIIMSGQSVSLRIVSESDIPVVWHWINDPEIIRFLRTPQNIFHFEDEKSWYESLSTRRQTDRVFIISRNSDSEPVGTMGIHRIDYYNGYAEIGYMIGREFWKNGYANEAVRLAVSYAKLSLNLRKLIAESAANNAGSRRVLEKNGFTLAGSLKEHAYVPGNGFTDLVIYELFLQ